MRQVRSGSANGSRILARQTVNRRFSINSHTQELAALVVQKIYATVNLASSTACPELSRRSQRAALGLGWSRANGPELSRLRVCPRRHWKICWSFFSHASLPDSSWLRISFALTSFLYKASTFAESFATTALSKSPSISATSSRL